MSSSQPPPLPLAGDKKDAKEQNYDMENEGDEGEEEEIDAYEEEEVDDGICNFCGEEMDSGCFFVQESRDAHIYIPGYMRPQRHFCDGTCLLNFLVRFEKEHGTLDDL